MFALDYQAGSWAKGRSFLRCYVDGRHDIIERDFPHFAAHQRLTEGAE